MITISQFISNSMLIITAMAFLAQFAIEMTSVNIASSSIAMAISVITILYMRCTNFLITNPLSTFAIFGLTFTTTMGALIFQSILLEPLDYNLRQPILTFSMLAMYSSIAMISHYLYCVFTSQKDSDVLIKHGLVVSILKFLRIYQTPKPMHLWIMGLLGALCLALSKVSAIANGFTMFAWAPFLILAIHLKEQESNNVYCNIKKTLIPLFIFAVVIFIIGMGLNARAKMLTGITTVGILFLLIGLQSKKKFTSKMFIGPLVFILVALALSWPLTRLANSMVIAREDREELTGNEMIERTVEVYLDSAELDKYKERSRLRSITTVYDEAYIDNPVLNRLVNTKYHDNSIYYGSKIKGENRKELAKVSFDMAYIALPQPMLDALEININKSDYLFSVGDEIVYLATGIKVGGYKLLTIFGEGPALFGIYFPFIYFFLCILLFYLIDIFSIKKNGVAVMSVLGMLSIWPNFLQGLSEPALSLVAIKIVRGIPQSILLYIIVYLMAKISTHFIISICTIIKKPEVRT